MSSANQYICTDESHDSMSHHTWHQPNEWRASCVLLGSFLLLWFRIPNPMSWSKDVAIYKRKIVFMPSWKLFIYWNIRFMHIFLKYRPNIVSIKNHKIMPKIHKITRSKSKSQDLVENHKAWHHCWWLVSWIEFEFESAHKFFMNLNLTFVFSKSMNLNFVFSKSINLNLNFVSSKSMNLNFVFSKSMNLNFVVLKSMNLNFKIRKKMNGSNPNWNMFGKDVPVLHCPKTSPKTRSFKQKVAQETATLKL